MNPKFLQIHIYPRYCMVSNAYIPIWGTVEANVKKFDVDIRVQEGHVDDSFNLLHLQNEKRDNVRTVADNDSITGSDRMFCLALYDGDDRNPDIPSYCPHQRDDCKFETKRKVVFDYWLASRKLCSQLVK